VLSEGVLSNPKANTRITKIVSANKLNKRGKRESLENQSKRGE
jgi:hypothetical protein